MGKVDDMRRRREAQHQARAASGRTSAAPPADGEGEPPPVAGADADAVPSGIDGEAAGSVPADADSGICSGCGKVKPMQRGLIANHQKGLGKFCVGSRKPPA